MNAQTAKYTESPCKVEVLGHTLRVTRMLHDHDNDDVAVLGDCHEEEEQANARLIAEAFNVAHETGLTPRQLADQRAELLSVAYAVFGACDQHLITNTSDADSVGVLIDCARKAIARATGEQP